MPSTASRVLRELEYLRKKLEIFKTILKQKEDWEMTEHLFEQTRSLKEAEYLENMEKQKIKQLGVTVKRSKPKRPRRKKDKTPYAEVDVVNPDVSKSEDELSSTFEDQKKCYRILSMMMKHEYARPFLVPVDHVKLRIPDYPQVIKNPMDLGTIKQQLRDGTILDMEEFVAKVRLTFRNAKIFNPVSNIIHQWAITLEKVFERKLSTVDRAAVQVMKREHEKAKKAQQLHDHNQERAKQRAKRSEYRDRKSKGISNPYLPLPSAKRRKTNPAAKSLTGKQIGPETFNEEEKENLRLMISDLPSEKLGGLLEILDVNESGETVQLDLDILSSTQLRDLQLYCKEVLGWNSRRPAKQQQKRDKLKAELDELQQSSVYY